MEERISLVITSVQSSDNPVLKHYAKACTEKQIDFIIAGDTKTPGDFRLEGCDYLDISAQQTLPFSLAKVLPHKNYAKKNIAYLQAIKKGSSIIIETDDDNLPAGDFWMPRRPEIKGDLVDTTGWVNVYAYFSGKKIWPRGFSLKHLKNTPPELITHTGSDFFSPVQQGLVNENPDVDAIYRLSMELPFYFDTRKPVVLGPGSVCPFNSQNTTWFRQAFPLLYLPSHCSFRMCDIWRSFIAQRILWENDWYLSFHAASANQQRNEHDLIRDLEEEVSGYLNNHAIVEVLKTLVLKKGEAYLTDNLRTCYKLLIERGYFPEEEMPLLEAWIHDLKSIL